MCARLGGLSPAHSLHYGEELGYSEPNVPMSIFSPSTSPLSRDQPMEIIFENVTANAMNAFRCIVAYSSRWSTLEISIKSYDLCEFLVARSLFPRRS